MVHQFDAGRLASDLLLPPFIALQGHADKCFTAAKEILNQAKLPPLAGNLSSLFPAQIQHLCSGFIEEAGRNLEMENILARIADHMRPAKKCQNSLYACLSAGHNQMNVERSAKHVFDIALSTEQVAEKLDGIPVYTVCNAAREFVLVSNSSNQKSLALFCFSRSDAEALLQKVANQEPSVGRGAEIVAVSLNKVYKLNAEGIAFRFLPDPWQVKNALEVRAQKDDIRRSFDGVPIFQSNNLIVRSNDIRFSPIFFCKEDLDQALQTAFHQRQKVTPSLQVNTDIEVGSFENVLKKMEGDHADGLGWGDIVFIPPGMTTLGHLEKPVIGIK